MLHIHHLIHFMGYTTDLELGHVNAAAHCMINGQLSQYFEDTIQKNALNLYTDEGYHALFSRHIADQVAKHFNLNRQKSERIKRLDELMLTTPERFQHFTRFAIGFISETLITQELSLLSRGDLIAPISCMFKDHLRDEGKHALFFSHCFAVLWAQLSEAERSFFVDILLKTIRAFCQPDITLIKLIFDAEPEICKSTTDYLNTHWEQWIAAKTKLTRQAIMRTDIVEHEKYLRQFRSGGLPL